VLIIPSSWGSQRALLTSHQRVFWRRCQGEKGLLQGKSLTHNPLLCFCFALFYFCLHRFIKNTKKIVSISSCFFMSSVVAVTMSPEEMIFTLNKRVRRVSKKLGLEFMIGMEKLNQK
jgi:hypothetical protein